MKPIRYPEGCALALHIPMVEIVSDGGQPIDPTKVTDLAGFLQLHGVVIPITPIIVDSKLTMQLDADLKAGAYVFGYSFKYDGLPFAGKWANVLEVVKDNAQSNWEVYVKKGVELDDQIYVAGPTLTDEEFEALKAEFREKIAEAEASKIAYDEAKAEADAVAYNAAHTLTEEGIERAVKSAIEEGVTVEVDLSPVTQRLDDPTHGLAALLDAINSKAGGGASIEEIQQALASLQLAMQGADVTATTTAIFGVVEAIQSSALTAQDKRDILDAIAQAAPTIDFTVVLEAIASSESAIKAAMPSTDGLALETSVQTVISMLTLADGEVTAELETLIPNE